MPEKKTGDEQSPKKTEKKPQADKKQAKAKAIKRSEADAKLSEDLFSHASEHPGGLRQMVKDLRKFGAPPALAVLKGLTALCKSRDTPDSIAEGKVYRSYETVRVRLTDLHEEAVAAEKADDAEKAAEIETAAARYAATHASIAATQAVRALGGQVKHLAVVKSKIIQALGTLSAD